MLVRKSIRIETPVESHELNGPRDRVSGGAVSIGAERRVRRISRRAIRRMSSPRRCGLEL
jgi:hypothetical protein